MSLDIGLTVITMLDDDADPNERANAATTVLTHLYGGGSVPAVWPNSRNRLIEIAREIRGMRQSLDNPVPTGTLIDEPLADKEPTDDRSQ